MLLYNEYNYNKNNLVIKNKKDTKT